MRKLLVQTFVSLDEVMQSPGAPEEDSSQGFTLGGWSVSYWDASMQQTLTEASQRYDLLLGRRTYETFAAHWPRIADDPVAEQLNRARKHVASRTLTDVGWSNSRLISGDVARLAQLKQEDGPETRSTEGRTDQTLLATTSSTPSAYGRSRCCWEPASDCSATAPDLPR